MAFIDGLTTLDDLKPQWWQSYVHCVLVRIISANRNDLLSEWCTLVGGTQIYLSASDDNLLSGVGFVSDGTTVIAAFQGTSNTLQVIAQIFQSPQSSFAGVQGAINGYYGACFFERKAAFQSIINGLPRTTKFFFTGHSAGGGIAHVAYKWFDEFEDFNAIGAITFGAPRVGNAYFAQNTRAPFLRVIAQDDFIVGIPPNTFQAFQLIGPLASTVLGLNYLHARDGIILYNDGTTGPGNASILDTWGPVIPNVFLRLRNCWPACYQAHLTANYATLLQRLAQHQTPSFPLGPFIAINAQIPP